MNYSTTRNMQNVNEQTMLHDLFEENNSELLDDVFFGGEDETYGDIPITLLEINQQEEDELGFHSSSTQISDLSDCDDEEFDLNPTLPCNDSEQLLADYLSSEVLDIFHEEDTPPRAISGSESTGPSVTPNDAMAKLARCMERSALSRSLVETFCQSSLKKASASQENIQVGSGSSSSSMAAMKKSRGCIQDNKISAVKASVSARSTKKHKIGYILRIKSKDQKPSDSVSIPRSKKNDDFRASGLKLSSKSKALIAKFEMLNRGKKNPDHGHHIIASFLRQEKLKSAVVQMNPQAA
jgi:hypothetical protein